MSPLAVKVEPMVVDVSCYSNTLHMILADGREVSVPLLWFPRLMKATPEQRNNWRLIGPGIGIHWKDVDEDIAVDTLLALS